MPPEAGSHLNLSQQIVWLIDNGKIEIPSSFNFWGPYRGLRVMEVAGRGIFTNLGALRRATFPIWRGTKLALSVRLDDRVAGSVH